MTRNLTQREMLILSSVALYSLADDLEERGEKNISAVELRYLADQYLAFIEQKG